MTFPGRSASRVLVEVADGVFVGRAALYATTTTVVVHAGDALVVDPGPTRRDVDALVADIGSRGWRVIAGFSTHPHWDHLLWGEALGDVPRWARARAVASARTRRGELLAEMASAVGPEAAVLRSTFARLTALPDDGAVPDLPFRALVIGHEAHACGHAALFLPEARVLVAGDMLSDVEVPLLDLDAKDPLGDYARGLDRLAGVITGGPTDVVIPGHGSHADPAEAIRRVALDRAYLADLAALRPSADPRLAAAAGWLREEHEAQVSAVAERRRHS
jgi:hydroxyacylglutathione hydrolase